MFKKILVNEAVNVWVQTQVCLMLKPILLSITWQYPHLLLMACGSCLFLSTPRCSFSVHPKNFHISSVTLSMLSASSNRKLHLKLTQQEGYLLSHITRNPEVGQTRADWLTDSTTASFYLFILLPSVCWLCPKARSPDGSKIAIPVSGNTTICKNIQWRQWHISLYVSV